jgi:aspartate/methionine/tyrosine aminotransferase
MEDVRLSGIREIFEALAAWAVRHPGETPIPFHVGMPDFDTPPHIKEALYAAVRDGFVGYTSSRGIPDLLAAIARKLERENGVVADPARHLVVTCGANEAISAAVTALIDPGDEVIVGDPAWPHYEACVHMAHARFVRCPLKESRGFAMDPADVASLWSPRTRMVVINSPHNPTGAVMSPGDIEAIAALARARGAWLLSDEAYERIVFDGVHLSPASLPGMQDTVITVGCLSKAYAMTGWRLGYLCGPEAVADAVNRVHLFTVSCAVSFVQKAAIAALDGDQACVASMVAAYRRRRELTLDLLHTVPGIEVRTPPGAFYAFPNIRAFGIPSRDLARRLVEEAGVGVVHGSAFGPAGEGYLRVAYVCSEQAIRTGVDRIKAVLTR